MEEILKESVIDSCIYLGTDTNPRLVLKKFIGDDWTDINIHSTTKVIMKNAFENCKVGALGIYTLTEPTSLIIEEDAFNGAQINTLWYDSSASDWAMYLFFKNSASNPIQYSTEVFFSNNRLSGPLNLNSATTINALAFYNCKLITSVQLRNTLTHVGAGAFAGCDNLEKVVYTGGSNWCDIIFDNETSNPLYYAKRMFDGTSDSANEITTITLNATHISNYAFINWEGLRDVTVSSNVATVGSHVFDGCSNLILNQDGQGLYIGTDTKILVSLRSDSTELCENNYVWVCDNVKNTATTNITYFLDTNHKILANAGSDFSNLNGVEFILTGSFQNLPTTLGDIELYVPSTVKSINSNAFSGCTSLKNISFDENSSLISIGNYAFSGCTALESISLPNSVNFCGEGCFTNCTSLQNINFGGSLDYIPSYCCYNCTALSQLTIAQHSNLIIGCKAFYNCQKITDFNYEISLTQTTGQIEVQENAFAQCINLQSLSMIASHITIGKAAFFGCLALETIYIDTINNLTIGEDAFGGCYNIVEVCTPHDIGAIAGSPAYGLLGYYAAAVVTTPKTFQNINGYRLYGDLDATGTIDYSTAFIVKYIGEDIELTLPEVYGIKSYAFYNSKEITQIVIPNLNNTLQIVGHHVFDKCNKLHFNLFNNGYYLGNSLIFIKPVNTDIKELRIAPQTRFICMGSLMDCNQLVKLEIPFIGDRKDVSDNYYQNLSLGYAFGKDGFDNSTTTNSMIYINNNFTNVTYYLPTSITSLALSSNVDTISYAALAGCGGLTSLTIPFVGRSGNETTASPASLLGYIFGSSPYDGASAITQFYGPTSSYSVTYYIPEGLSEVKVSGGSSILYGAFSNCAALTSVEIADSTSIIAENTFRGCNHLNNIVLPFVGNRSDATTPSASTFFGYIFGPDNTNSITQRYYDENRSDYVTFQYYLPADLTKVTVTTYGMQEGAFSGCAQLTSIILPTDITNIKRDMFYECTGLTTISLPNTITSIGARVFYKCSSLSEVEGFANTNITVIENGLFYDCISLGDIVVPSNVTLIDYSAFYGCRVLQNITLPGGVLKIGTSAFSGCTMLPSITLPEGIQEIGNHAFYNCLEFTDFIIPDSVVLIGYNAFEGCDLNYNTDGYGQYLGNPNHPCLCLMGSYNSPSSSFIFNESCKIIYSSVFDGWTQLSSITLPNTITDIGYRAFYGCTGLSSINFSNSLIRIQSNAFYGCTGLSSITTPASLRIIEDNTFRNCNFTTDITLTEGLQEIGAYAFANSLKSAGGHDVVVPSTVTSIGSGVFSGCSTISSLELPFVGRYLDASTASEQSLFGYIFGTSNYTDAIRTEQHWASGSGHAVNYYLPGWLTYVAVRSGKILYGSFYNCTNLSFCHLYPEVESIENRAFYRCQFSVINFHGTKAQWGEIELSSDWKYQSSISKIRCTDGDISV